MLLSARRLSNKKADAMFTTEEYEKLWSDPAARGAKAAQDKLRAVKPHYLELSKQLKKREWETEVYEKTYEREIYSSYPSG
jgi:hypothetical protein